MRAIKGIPKKLETTLSCVLLISTIVVTALLIAIPIVASLRLDTHWQAAPKPEELRVIGEYSEDGETWYPLQDGEDQLPNGLPRVYIRGHFSRDLKYGEGFIMRFLNLHVELRLNGEMIVDYGEVTEDSLTKATGGRIGFYYVEDVTSEDAVELLLENPYYKARPARMNEFLQRSEAGYGYQAYSGALQRAWLPITMGSMSMLIGFLFFMMSISMIRLNRRVARKSIALSAFAFVCGMYVIVGALYYDLALFMKLPLFCSALETGLPYLLVLFGDLYVWAVLNDSKTRPIPMLAGLLTAAATFVVAMLQFAGWLDLEETRTTIYYVGALSVALCFAAMAYASQWEHNKEARRALLDTLPMMLMLPMELLAVNIDVLPQHVFLRVATTVTIIRQGLLLVRQTYERERMERQNDQLEAQLQQSRVEIMLSQIQPHFLYNTLSSIERLCEIDPKRAQEATGNFARFMRGNMDSLGAKENIPFDQELKHLQTYLALEQMRFGDILRIEYRIGVRNFRIPPLTLQPLVENAVRHGVTKREDGGTVSISTERLADGSIVITVADDGIGFDPNAPKKKDGRSHIGVENVRSHIAARCGGTLVIQSEVGVGTVSRITIPPGNEMKEETEEASPVHA